MPPAGSIWAKKKMGGFEFQRVGRADLPMLADWLGRPEVSRWWTDPDRQIGMIEGYLDQPAIVQLLICRNRHPIAYAQFYPANHWGAVQYAGLPFGAIGLDAFAGPDGMGHGADWLKAIGDLLLAEAPLLAVDPSPDNVRAIRAYEKAGFAGASLFIDDLGQTVRVMTRRR